MKKNNGIIFLAVEVKPTKKGTTFSVMYESDIAKKFINYINQKGM